jgi:succinate dehydrogenase (ubiquinone) iron-sulfur subunit
MKVLNKTLISKNFEGFTKMASLYNKINSNKIYFNNNFSKSTSNFTGTVKQSTHPSTGGLEYFDKSNKIQSDTIYEEFEQNLSEEEKKNRKRFNIHKYDPSESHIKKIVSYHVDIKDCGPMILDALIHIKDDIDPSLSFRRSCREGICGSCSMNVDGRNTLACLSYIDKDLTTESQILPLPYFAIVRDLVVDMTNFYMQYKSIMPVLQRKTEKPKDGPKEYYQSEEDRKKLDGLYECILCACCQSNCPSYWWQSNEYLGPAVLMQAYRWIIDSRDEYKQERLEALSGQKLDRCYQIGVCSLTCPKGLDPRAAIKQLHEMYAEYKYARNDDILI